MTEMSVETPNELPYQTSAQARPTNAEEPGSPRLAPIGVLAHMLRPIRAHLLAGASLSALAAAFGLAPYVAAAEIARTVLGASSPAAVSSTLWLWMGVGVVGAFARLVLLGLSSHVGHNADAEMLHQLRVRIVRRLGDLPPGWFRSAGSGEVKKAMTDDLEHMHELFAHALGGMLGAATALVVSVAYLAFTDLRMAFITVLVPMLALVSYRLAMRSLPNHMTRLLASEGRISAASVEYLDGIGVVKTFGTRAGDALNRFSAAMNEHTRAYEVWVAEIRKSSALNRVLGSEMAVLGAVLAVGIWFVASGSLAVADLLPFLIVGVGLPTAFGPVIHGAQGVRMARVAAGHIERLLSRAPLPEPARPEEPRGHRIEMERVTFSYDGTRNAVESVSAVCEPGTVTALVGPSGGGKTTLASLLARFYDVTQGGIRIGGVDLRKIGGTRLLSLMSLVFQDVLLLRDTVKENIRIGRPEATDDEVRKAAKAAQIHDVIERLPQGYNTILGAGGGGLSGGEKQRLTIARAVLANAPIIILDEATAALDPDNEAAVQSALAELVAGKTVLVIAHRLHTIKDADQILVLDRGKIVERGTHENLIALGGSYARMWRAQEAGA